MHSFIFLASFEFAFAAILFVFHQSQDLVPRSSHYLSWPPFWINFQSPWTNQSRDFCCVPGSSLLPPPYWKARRPWGRGWGRAPRGDQCIFWAVAKHADKMADKTWLLFSLLTFACLCEPCDSPNALICSDSINKISPVSDYYWKPPRSFPNVNMLRARDKVSSVNIHTFFIESLL